MQDGKVRLQTAKYHTTHSGPFWFDKHKFYDKNASEINKWDASVDSVIELHDTIPDGSLPLIHFHHSFSCQSGRNIGIFGMNSTKRTWKGTKTETVIVRVHSKSCT